jgi:hypothetical protein
MSETTQHAAKRAAVDAAHKAVEDAKHGTKAEQDAAAAQLARANAMPN